MPLAQKVGLAILLYLMVPFVFLVFCSKLNSFCFLTLLRLIAKISKKKNSEKKTKIISFFYSEKIHLPKQKIPP